MSNSSSSNNNNTTTRNVYNTTTARTTMATTTAPTGDDEDEMEMLLHHSNNRPLGTEYTAINIENDMEPGTSQQLLLRQQLLRSVSSNSAGINTETNAGNAARVPGTTAAANGNSSESSNGEERQRIRNILSMFREARHQLHRSQSMRDPQQIIPVTANGEPMPPVNSHPRTWRENLYDVLASPVTPRSDVFRSFFTNASSNTTNVRYNSLPTNDIHLPEENFHFLLNRQTGGGVGMQDTEMQASSRNGLETQSSTSGLRLSRQSSRFTDERSVGESVTSPPQTPAELPIDNGAGSGGSRRQSNATSTTNAGGGGGSGGRGQPQRQTSGTGSTAPTIEMDDADTNAVGEMIVKLVSHFVRYLPFIFILFVKFIHDHLLGILDLILLHGIMYQINKSLKDQIAKLTQKSYGALIRDMILVVCVVTYRFLLATSTPDPFGLLINPPGATITLDFSTSQKSEESERPSDVIINQILSSNKLDEVPSSPTPNPLNSTISVTKTLSLGVLLYYVAVNDLILKLLTQLVKLTVTLLPTKVIRHKSRARLYALVEYISQFYRAMVPMRQWLTFLFESYTGLEVISGILFSAFYMGAKGFEFVERGKSLKKALINFVRNMDYDRKPTKDELEAAGTVCPICHDSYTTPVVLECSHIFCDECVNTWFKREQTCPMCRAKVSEDPTWQDGATTYFYQLC